MVLFTSRSSLTCRILHVLCLASPPAIHPLSTLNNWLLKSFQRLYDDQICILCQQGRKVGEGHDASMGKSQYLPLPELPGTLVSYLWGTTFHQQPKNLGGCSGTPQWCGLSPSSYRRNFGGSELGNVPSMDKSPSSSGVHNEGGNRDTVCLHLQWTQLAICSYTAIQGFQPYTTSQGQAFRHSVPGIDRGEPVWTD